MMNPDQMCKKWIQDQPSLPDRFELNLDGCHGIEMYVCPFPDQSGTLMQNIFVKGATRASVEDGGTKLEFVFPRGNSICSMMPSMQTRFAANLTNHKTKETFGCMASMFQVLMDTKQHHQTVVGVMDIRHFVAQEELCVDLWPSGTFDVEGDLWCVVTLRDRRARGLHRITTQFFDQRPSPPRSGVPLGPPGVGFGSPGYPNGHEQAHPFMGSYYGNPSIPQGYYQAHYQQPPVR